MSDVHVEFYEPSFGVTLYQGGWISSTETYWQLSYFK
jgi:hypothetical protein